MNQESNTHYTTTDLHHHDDALTVRYPCDDATGMDWAHHRRMIVTAACIMRYTRYTCCYCLLYGAMNGARAMECTTELDMKQGNGVKSLQGRSVFVSFLLHKGWLRYRIGRSSWISRNNCLGDRHVLQSWHRYARIMTDLHEPSLLTCFSACDVGALLLFV